MRNTIPNISLTRRVDTRFSGYTSAGIVSTAVSDAQYLEFEMADGSRGHINIKGGYALAHVTYAAGGRLVNYYYEVTGPGEVDPSPADRLVSGGATEKKLSDMPTPSKTAVLAMLRDIYA